MPDTNADFTLVELLAVIAIITILAGMIIGGVAVGMRKASEAKTRGQMHQLEVAIEQYRQIFGYFPPAPRIPDPVTLLPQKMLEKFVKGDSPDPPYAVNPRLPGLERPNPDSTTAPGEYLVQISAFEFSGGYVVDGFGNPYYYQCPGVMNPQSFDLWSTGVDGLHGTAASTDPTKAQNGGDCDDLTNWKKQ